MDDTSPVGAMFKGTGLFLGAMITCYELNLQNSFLWTTDDNLKLSLRRDF